MDSNCHVKCSHCNTDAYVGFLAPSQDQKTLHCRTCGAELVRVHIYMGRRDYRPISKNLKEVSHR